MASVTVSIVPTLTAKWTTFTFVETTRVTVPTPPARSRSAVAWLPTDAPSLRNQLPKRKKEPPAKSHVNVQKSFVNYMPIPLALGMI